MGNISGHDKSGENKLDHLIAGADLIVVGAGFYGSTMAETTARILIKKSSS